MAMSQFCSLIYNRGDKPTTTQGKKKDFWLSIECISEVIYVALILSNVALNLSKEKI